MAVVRYIATRTIMAGHSVGGVYTLTLSLAELDRNSKPDVNASKSMGGDYYGLMIRHEIEWACQTGPLRLTAADAVREFLDSCGAKEVFEFAPYDSAATPSPRYRNAVLDGRGYKEKRVAMRPGGGEQDYFTFSFTAEEVP